MKKILILIMFLLMPISTVLAYSTEVILGGQNIGIEVKTKGVLVIGLYKINDEYIAKESGITSGDYIVKVNSNEIKDIDDFTNQINLDEDKESIDITYKRDNKYYDTNLVLYNDNGEYKTGLYVRDTINGIGTLTMIDPATKKFLALGHQILDSNTKTTLDIDKGSIYYSYITGINKSNNGNIGDKQATSYVEDKYGTINSNTNMGIFGDYEKEIDTSSLIKIANKNEITLGKASILTSLDKDTVNEYSINIDSIDYDDELKNILFTITDKELLDRAGGIVQGMSGSPIIQNNKLVGAVTHVIVDDCKKGYGIFIVNMLEKSEEN